MPSAGPKPRSQRSQRRVNLPREVATTSATQLALQAESHTADGAKRLRRSLHGLFALHAAEAEAAKAGGGRTAGAQFAVPRLEAREGVSSEQLWGQLNVLYAPILRSLEGRVDTLSQRRTKRAAKTKGHTEGAKDHTHDEEGAPLGVDDEAREGEEGAAGESYPHVGKKEKKPPREDAWRYAFGVDGAGDEDDDDEEKVEGDGAGDEGGEGEEGDEDGEEDRVDLDMDAEPTDDAAAMAELYGEGQYGEEDYPFGGDGDPADDADEGLDGDGLGPEDDHAFDGMEDDGAVGPSTRAHPRNAYPRPEAEEDAAGLTTFEVAERKRLRQTSELEESRLFSKDWAMGGEVAAAARPRDALLDEKLEFEHAMRPVPVITARVTEKLELRIKRRIADGNFDDVQRRQLRTTAADLRTTKRDEGIDAQKSKLSLMDLYEKEYLEKQKKAEQLGSGGDGAPVAEPLTEVEKDELKALNMWRRLSQHLDALSNFYFTPLPVEQDLEARTRAVEGNVPAVAMESVGLAGVVSTEAALAPQDLYRQSKSKFVGVDRAEMDPREKRALRRQHKTFGAEKKQLIQLVKSTRRRGATAKKSAVVQ